MSSEIILGVRVHATNLAKAMEKIDRWIAERRSYYVCPAPAHTVMESRGDVELRRSLNSSGLTTPDGMSLVWLLMLKGHRNVNRVYGPDLLLGICERGLARGYQHYFYGGHRHALEALTSNLQSRIAGLAIAGAHSPPFRALSSAEDQAVVDEINRARPDIVWVGLGSPKQEKWMAAHRDRLEAPVLIGVGAAFDFLSGRKPQAPRWMQRAGLEWAFRLATEPTRLWPRYRQYPLFIVLVLAEALGLRKSPPIPDHSASGEEIDNGIEV